MKKKVCLLFTLPLLLLATGCGEKEEKEEVPMEIKDINVVIISGQSNGVGCSRSECLLQSLNDNGEKYKEYNDFRKGKLL